MKTVKEMRKEISEGLTDICVYDDIEEMKTYVLNAIAVGIKNSIKGNPYCYEYNQNYLFKMSDKINENNILEVIVDSLVSSGYIDNGCKCEYDDEKEEYHVKIQLFLYSFTQKEKKKLEIDEQTVNLFPVVFISGVMIPFLLPIFDFFGITPFVGKLIFVICTVLLFLLPCFIMCFTDSVTKKIIKSKWKKQL